MATLAVENVTPLGITPTQNAADAVSDVFPNDGKIIARIINSSGANAYTVDVVTSATVVSGGASLAVADIALSVATSGTELFGPFPTEHFGANVTFTYTGTAPATDLVVELIRVP
jgi:hypothetical protein